jgi:hypothetical protein
LIASYNNKILKTIRGAVPKIANFGSIFAKSG